MHNAFDSHIALLHWNVVHVGAWAAALIAAQALKVASSLATLMKDCNANLTNALCTALSVPDMAAYHYLTNLDFVKDASGCKTHFGRIPQADVRFPNLRRNAMNIFV
jgi:hypothetical protein